MFGCFLNQLNGQRVSHSAQFCVNSTDKFGSISKIIELIGRLVLIES